MKTKSEGSSNTSTDTSIRYRRTGRTRCASGWVIERGPNGMMKVNPRNPNWNRVWVSPDEINAGKYESVNVPSVPPADEKFQPKESDV